MTENEFRQACHFGFGLWSERVDTPSADAVRLAWASAFQGERAPVFRDALLRLSNDDARPNRLPTVAELRRAIGHVKPQPVRPALPPPSFDAIEAEREAAEYKRKGWHRTAAVFESVAQTYRNAKAAGQTRHPGFPLEKLTRAMMLDAGQATAAAPAPAVEPSPA